MHVVLHLRQAFISWPSLGSAYKDRIIHICENSPYTFKLKIRSSSPAGLVATQVYFPVSELRALKMFNVLPSGVTLQGRS